MAFPCVWWTTRLWQVSVTMATVSSQLDLGWPSGLSWCRRCSCLPHQWNLSLGSVRSVMAMLRNIASWHLDLRPSAVFTICVRNFSQSGIFMTAAANHSVTSTEILARSSSDIVFLPNDFFFSFCAKALMTWLLLAKLVSHKSLRKLRSSGVHSRNRGNRRRRTDVCSLGSHPHRTPRALVPSSDQGWHRRTILPSRLHIWALSLSILHKFCK